MAGLLRSFSYNLVFLDALKTPNYYSKEILIKSCKIHIGLHKHHFYFYRTDFAMKQGYSACLTAFLKAVKKVCNFVMLRILARSLFK